MTEPASLRTSDEIATTIISAYVSANVLPAAEMPGLITSVRTKVAALMSGEQPAVVVAPPALKSAVPISKSITPDFLICLEDGKKFRSLKRHLGTVYDLTPEAYRAKWGLPPDYPMVAPAYSAVRSQLAKGIGLGRRGVAA